ncbi:MAG: type II toxin-antitoxin system RelE/ParE family toxin [Rickettsiales bacterium]
MSYSVKWDDGAIDDLRSLGKAEAIRIVKKIESHLVKDPLSLGKPLSGNLANLYRYRIGNYRVIYQIFRDELIVAVVRIGHRKDVYG